NLGESSPYNELAVNQPAADVSRAEHLPAVASAEAGPAVPQEPDYSGSVRGTSDPKDDSQKGIIFQIETDKIAPNPHQPRRDFDAQSLQELANSVREFGVIQPLIVTKVEKESERGWTVSYELVAGERRLMASKIVGLRTVPAIIRQVPRDHEKLELAITENVQRANLNPIEFARAIARLQEEFKLTQREIATRLGKSREAVANSVRLLSLPSEVQEAVSAGKISESQARLLLSVDDVAQREKLFQEITAGNLTVREISSRVRQWKGKPESEDTDAGKTSSAIKAIDPELLALKEELETALGAPVELKREGEGGKLTINFYSKEELEGILAKFKQNDSQSL
ncbi:MAG: ParB/RepB/Spo0J family partition protein, partial [Candidatus Colwellbacteria bacterium]